MCKMSAVLLASGHAASELTAGGCEGDRREQASALNDLHEHLVKKCIRRQARHQQNMFR